MDLINKYRKVSQCYKIGYYVKLINYQKSSLFYEILKYSYESSEKKILRMVVLGKLRIPSDMRYPSILIIRGILY